MEVDVVLASESVDRCVGLDRKKSLKISALIYFALIQKSHETVPFMSWRTGSLLYSSGG